METIVGKRIAIYWPSVKKWYSGTIIGYTTTKAANLIYYDERTPNVSPQEDFYQAPLFQTKTNQTKLETWKLLTPAVVSNKIPGAKHIKKTTHLKETSTDLELAQELFGTRRV